MYGVCIFRDIVHAMCVLYAAVVCLQGCVARGQLGSTTCHRMLMATLLPLPASLLALAKVKLGTAL
jgi:hypothetical protein